jgi:hypothetical protein
VGECRVVGGSVLQRNRGLLTQLLSAYCSRFLIFSHTAEL